MFISAPPLHAAAITPSDVTDLAVPTRYIWVSVSGAISVQMYGSANTVVFSAVPVGWFGVQATRVNATGTTATGLVAGW